MLHGGRELLKRLNDLGYDAYIVGGAPRDILLGKQTNDIDIATNCPMGVLQKEFRTYPIGKSKSFGILLVELDGFHYEVAQFRSEADYDGRRPGKVEIVGTLREDVTRRDFTINALAMGADERIIDYVNGIVDIHARCIRTVGSPIDRFTEDHLRMIRAARFGSKDGFYIEKHTRKAIRKLYKLINKVTPERIRMELFKAAEGTGAEFAKFIVLLDELKLLGQILPEVQILKYYRHNMQHHPEGPRVFDHVIECLKLTDGFDPLTKIAVLLHDVGKSISFFEKGGLPKYHRHERYGAVLVEQLCDRLKFSFNAKERIIYTTKNHMKFHRLLEMKASKIARMVSSPHFETLIDVNFADNFSRGETFMYHEEFDKQVTEARRIRDKWEEQLSTGTVKIIDGKRILKLAGIKPSPLVGKIKTKAEGIIIDRGLDPNQQEIVDEVILEVYKDVENTINRDKEME